MYHAAKIQSERGNKNTTTTTTTTTNNNNNNKENLSAQAMPPPNSTENLARQHEHALHPPSSRLPSTSLQNPSELESVYLARTVNAAPPPTLLKKTS